MIFINLIFKTKKLLQKMSGNKLLQRAIKQSNLLNTFMPLEKTQRSLRRMNFKM